ncbi:MAG: 50S ribosomal protein L30 [Candidatus Syntrophoarchaeum caldarius]|uniref:50S ribosomal protein L30 n=1 Tax=Candidatus Syntropharchaeum caldarium TaxID=1838285 RepID=A0A1F2P959_9EURY|nr:MAG: 50S ribosomal protein L30 [Candidatus Syntrophoarchaeum caldarius]
MDMDRALKIAMRTGKVVLGTKQTLKSIRNGRAKVVVVSANCPDSVRDKIEGVPIQEYKGLNTELGPACGKPFPVSVLAVIEPGDSGLV